MNFRKDWEENVSLLVGCFALLLHFLIDDSEHGFAKGIPHDTAAMLLLSTGAFFSARTAIRFASRFLPTIGWWLRGLLRWTFWWMLHFIVVFISVEVAASVTSVPFQKIVTLALGLATLLLARQAIRDCAAARRRFGSITQAERAHYTARKRSQT